VVWVRSLVPRKAGARLMAARTTACRPERASSNRRRRQPHLRRSVSGVLELRPGCAPQDRQAAARTREAALQPSRARGGDDRCGRLRPAPGSRRASRLALAGTARTEINGKARRSGPSADRVPLGSPSLTGVDRHPAGAGGTGDEGRVRAHPVQVRPPDRARVEVGPVDVAGGRHVNAEVPPSVSVSDTVNVYEPFARPL
jgi:hypothetical protein